MTVVGVVADTRYREIETARLDLYLPYEQFESPIRFFVIRTTGDPSAIAADVRRAVRAVDPSQPVELQTMDEIVETAMGRWRLNARLFGVLALLALLLAAVGTYSVMSYAVSRRTHEIGVRMALGAGRSEIARMVLGDGLRLALVWCVGGVGRRLLGCRAASSPARRRRPTRPDGVWRGGGSPVSRRRSRGPGAGAPRRRGRSNARYSD